MDETLEISLCKPLVKNTSKGDRDLQFKGWMGRMGYILQFLGLVFSIFKNNNQT